MRKELADLGIPSTVILDSAVGYGLLFSILFLVYHLLILYSLCKHFLHLIIFYALPCLSFTYFILFMQAFFTPKKGLHGA